jgi:hypothetical protein
LGVPASFHAKLAGLFLAIGRMLEGNVDPLRFYKNAFRNKIAFNQMASA